MDASIAAVKIPPERISKIHGTVAVWLTHEKKVRRVFPIDARELIAMGSATLEIPRDHENDAVEPEPPDKPEIVPTSSLLGRRAPKA